MVKIEKISAGAVVSILRNGERINLFEKQLISYAEADTIEVTGGEVIYSVNETEVHTKSGKSAPAVAPVATEPELPATEEVKIIQPKPVIKQPAAKTAKK